MSLLLLRRLAIIATPILFLAATPALSLSARADDPPQTAHSSAVLDRIFANWKARHDRVRSFHFTLDCRTTLKKGTLNFLSDPPTPFERDQVFQQFGAQYWMEGDDRRCLINTPGFKIPQVKPVDTGRIAERWVMAGDKSLWYHGSPLYETGTAPLKAFSPHGFLRLHSEFEVLYPNGMVRPLMLAFRPEDSIDPWLRAPCRLIDENAAVDEGRYVKFQRVLMPRRGDDQRREEACWVSPARDDVVVHWSTKTSPTSSWEGSIKYKKDKTHGWVPWEWSSITEQHIYECKVAAYTINEKIDPAVFALEFPPGTAVLEQLAPDVRKARQYVVQNDGSKRMISYEGFGDRAGWTAPPKKQAPAKPKAK
jgi:hypothetical protein